MSTPSPQFLQSMEKNKDHPPDNVVESHEKLPKAQFTANEENLLVFSNSGPTQVIKTIRLKPSIETLINWKKITSHPTTAKNSNRRIVEVKLCDIHSRVFDWNTVDVRALSGPVKISSFKTSSSNRYEKMLNKNIRIHLSSSIHYSTFYEQQQQHSIIGRCVFVDQDAQTLGLSLLSTRNGGGIGKFHPEDSDNQEPIITVIDMNKINRIDVFSVDGNDGNGDSGQQQQQRGTSIIHSSEVCSLNALIEMVPIISNNDDRNSGKKFNQDDPTKTTRIVTNNKRIKIQVSYLLERIQADVSYKMYVSRGRKRQNTSMNLMINNKSLGVPINNTSIKFLANVKNSEMTQGNESDDENETTDSYARSLPSSSLSYNARGSAPMMKRSVSRSNSMTSSFSSLVDDEVTSAASEGQGSFSASLLWPDKVNIPEFHNFYTSTPIISDGPCHFENIYETSCNHHHHHQQQQSTTNCRSSSATAIKSFIVWENISKQGLPAGVCTIFEMDSKRGAAAQEILHTFQRPAVSSEQKIIRNRIKNLKGVTCLTRNAGSKYNQDGSVITDYEFEFDNQTPNDEIIHIHMTFPSAAWENSTGLKFTPKTPYSEYEQVNPSLGVSVVTVKSRTKTTFHSSIMLLQQTSNHPGTLWQRQ